MRRVTFLPQTVGVLACMFFCLGLFSVLRFVVGKIDANIVQFVASHGRILHLGLSHVLDDIEQGQVGTNGEGPRHETFRGGHILAIEIQGQFGRTGVVKQAIMVFHELNEKASKRASIPGIKIASRLIWSQGVEMDWQLYRMGS